MAELLRPKPQIEYRSPRPIILGLCFFWGVGLGFSLNFIRPREPDPEQPPVKAQSQVLQVVERSGSQGEPDVRSQSAPNITAVAPEAPVSRKLTLESFKLEPPPPVMTTEGGLTGRTSISAFGSPTRVVQSAQPQVPVSSQPAAAPVRMQPQPGQPAQFAGQGQYPQQYPQGQGQYPVQGQYPAQGQYQAQTQPPRPSQPAPGQGQYAPAPQGQYPAQGTYSIQGQYISQGQYAPPQPQPVYRPPAPASPPPPPLPDLFP